MQGRPPFLQPTGFQRENLMHNLKRLLIILMASILALALLAVGVGVVFTDFIVDFWWHSELGFAEFFWLKLLYRYILSGGITLVFFLLFFFNFWAASRYLGVDEKSFVGLGRTESTRRRRFLRAFQTGSVQVFAPLSLVLAIAIALPFYKEWHAALLFVFGPDSGLKDPVFNHEISFYLFSYPVFRLIQAEMLAASAILTLALALLYWMEHRISSGDGKPWARGARVHLTLMVFVTALIVVWGLLLERFQLLYTEAHEPQFFGPGFLENNYYVPLIWIAIISLMGGVGAIASYVHTRKGAVGAVGFSLIFALAILVNRVSFIPEAINRFVVEPNPVKTEERDMQNNIEATLTAYDLKDVTTIDMTASLPESGTLDTELRSHLYDIPIWDHEFLDDVYQQLQGIRPYYRFTNADTARYLVNNRLEQVNLAAREVNLSRLPLVAQNWENTHLRYTHGYGAVVTPASQDGQIPMSWYLKDLDLQGFSSFAMERPDIYYGEENLPYAIVPNRLRIEGIPSVDEQSSYNYTGNGGIPISSLVRKLLVALYLRDEKMFFSIAVDGKSRVMIHRNIIDRVRTLTPFLQLDHDPYVAITPKRMYWIIDAYSTSDWYPVSKRSFTRFNSDADDRQINYIRNSVKVVVDAFDGTVDYYVSDPSDPVIQGYRQAYPGLFKDIATMPPDLKNQLRYPRDLFSVQMKIYGRYHQQQAGLFYEQAETWDFARVNDAVVKPYFLTTALEDYLPDQHSFVLINPMTPIGRSNLSALAVGGTFTTEPGQSGNGVYKNRMVVYRFTREVQVDGPAQVSALIDQDPEIAKQLALWDQRSSRVLRGHIIVLPVKKSVLYVQPMYIVSSSGTRIPELQRIILSMGNVVVMSASLEEGITELERRLKLVRERMPRLQPSAAPATLPGDGPTMSPR